MIYRQLFFIENRLLAEAPRGLIRVHEALAPPTSDLYFCPHCGDTWARFPVMKSAGGTTSWQSYRFPCRKCHATYHTHWLVPGSITRSWDHEFLAALPAPVLQWEFERHIDHFERIES